MGALHWKTTRMCVCALVVLTGDADTTHTHPQVGEHMESIRQMHVSHTSAHQPHHLKATIRSTGIILLGGIGGNSKVRSDDATVASHQWRSGRSLTYASQTATSSNVMLVASVVLVGSWCKRLDTQGDVLVEIASYNNSPHRLIHSYQLSSKLHIILHLNRNFNSNNALQYDCQRSHFRHGGRWDCGQRFEGRVEIRVWRWNRSWPPRIDNHRETARRSFPIAITITTSPLPAHGSEV